MYISDLIPIEPDMVEVPAGPFVMGITDRQADRLPVVGVSWCETSAYCRCLSETTDRNYRLPGEVEWEKVARGVDGSMSSWSEIWI